MGATSEPAQAPPGSGAVEAQVQLAASPSPTPRRPAARRTVTSQARIERDTFASFVGKRASRVIAQACALERVSRGVSSRHASCALVTAVLSAPVALRPARQSQRANRESHQRPTGHAVCDGLN